MWASDYRAALAELGLSPYAAAPLLGVSIRQSHRYAAGEQAVAPPVALLLRMYLAHGLPKSP
jgi:plasmid maintenance system antidote protein VapI